MNDKKKCEFCDKHGVPILPLRYAVVPAGNTAPQATDTSSPAIAATAAFYTKRLLRSGYLYVFDEARDRWESYYVTPQALFFKLAETPGIPPVVPQKPFDCPDAAHRAVASCITIRDAKNATKVWLGFSDVQWTASARKRHASATYRKRHMRCVDVKAFAASVDKAHTLGIHTVGQHVAEYALADKDAKKALGWSPFAVDARQAQLPRLIQECENLARGKGFAVVLDDPAGVAQEVAFLMKRNHDLFVNNDERKRAVTIDGQLDQMELTIKQQGERNRLMKAQRDASNATNPGYMGAGDGGAAAGGMALARAFNKNLDASLSAIEEDIKNVPGPELDAAATEAWAKYAGKLDHTARAAWRKKFDAELKSYDEKYIAPLAIAHHSLMQGASITAYFECNYDTADIRVGHVYASIYHLCTVTTSDKKACSDLYTQWLKGDVADTSNLLLQALTYNYKPLQETIVAAVKGSTDWGGMPWDKVIESIDKATHTALNGHADVLGHIIGAITGPIARTLIDAAKSPKVFAGLVALGAAARQPVVVVDIVGGRKAFRASLVRQLIRMSGEPVSPQQMNRAVAEELRRLRMHGVPLEGTDKKRWLLMIDPAEVTNMPRGLTPTARAQWLAKNIKTPEAVEALNLQGFRLKVNKVTGVVGQGLPVGFAVLGVVANWVAMDSVRESERKAMEHNKSEGLRRVHAQGAQLLGAAASTLEALLVRLPIMSSGVALSVKGFAVRILGGAGKVLGVGGSLVMSIIDIWRAKKEWDDGNFQGFGAYAVSAALGVAATLLLFFGVTGIGLIVVGLMIVWALIMPLLVDDNLQDWLERCLWGKLAKERYPNLDKEMAELKTAMS